MGRHARDGQPSRGHLRLVIIAGAVCLVAGGTAAAVTATRGHSASSATSPDCRGGTIDVVVRADPSADGWLGTLAGRYAAAHHLVDNQCVVPKVDSLSFAAAGSVVRTTPYPGSGPAPDVWVPDSTSAFDLLHAQTDSAAVLPTTVSPIATSPLVLAAPQQTVTAWRRDGADGDLAALLNVNADSRAQLSVPDPNGTGTGIAAVLAATAKTTGAPINDTTFSSATARLGLIRLGSRIATTAADGPKLLAAAGPKASADHLVAVSEHDVWQYNKSHHTGRLASYNAFGAARAVDYPYVIVNGSWVKDETKRAAADFARWLTSPATQASLAQFGLRHADGTAGSLAGSGVDGAHGRLDAAAAAAPVIAAHSAWTLLTTHRSVLSLIDVSASMSSVVPGTTQTKLQLARNTATDALQYFTDDDAIGLSEFSTSLDGGTASYKALVPLAPAGRSDTKSGQRMALSQAYQSLKPQHGTALYDAVLSAFTDAQQHALPGAVNVVTVLTDGDDATSTINLDTLLAQLKKQQDPAQPVHIVTIAYGADANEGVLKQIAAATGGAFFSAKDPRSINTVFISALAALAK